MTADAMIAQLVKTVTKELGRRKPSHAVFEYGNMVAEQDLTAGLLVSFIVDLRRNSLDDRTAQAYNLLLSLALSQHSLDVNGGRSDARRALDGVSASLAAEIAKSPIPPDGLMLIARCFADANCDPGPALKDALRAAIAANPAQQMDLGPAEFAAQFDDMAKLLDHDPVAIHSEVCAITAALPPELRAILASAMATSKTPSLVGAALGFVLDADDAIARDVLAALGMAGSRERISSQTVERLVRMRPWLPATRHDMLDAAVRTLRRRVAPSVAVIPARLDHVVVTLPDGSGAASIFVTTQHGTKFNLNLVLLKSGKGIVDAWVDRGMSKRATAAKLYEIGERIGTIPVSFAFATRMLSNGLAQNLAGARPPPLGLLEVVENLGLARVPAESSPPEILVAELLHGLPASRTDGQASAVAAEDSAGWGSRFRGVDMWFEANETVDGVLGKVTGRRARFTAVMAQVLPPRRDFWVERCAWLAATLHEQPDFGGWIDVALVARALAAGAALPTVGLMNAIAMTTVEAFEANNPEPRAPRRRATVKTKRR